MADGRWCFGRFSDDQRDPNCARPRVSLDASSVPQQLRWSVRALHQFCTGLWPHYIGSNVATVRVNPSNVPVLKRQPAVTSFEKEFETVDIVLASHAETRGVDAFALSLIKCERQARRLLTHIVFQFPCFSAKDIPALRSALSANKGVYFDGVIRGIDHLYPLTVQELVGNDYLRLIHRLNEAIDHRNKLFHQACPHNRYLYRSPDRRVHRDADSERPHRRYIA